MISGFAMVCFIHLHFGQGFKVLFCMGQRANVSFLLFKKLFFPYKIALYLSFSQMLAIQIVLKSFLEN